MKTMVLLFRSAEEEFDDAPFSGEDCRDCLLVVIGRRGMMFIGPPTKRCSLTRS